MMYAMLFKIYIILLTVIRRSPELTHHYYAELDLKHRNIHVLYLPEIRRYDTICLRVFSFNSSLILKIPSVVLKFSRYEWYEHRVDKMNTARLDHVKREMCETFLTGRRDHMISA